MAGQSTSHCKFHTLQVPHPRGECPRGAPEGGRGRISRWWPAFPSYIQLGGGGPTAITVNLRPELRRPGLKMQCLYQVFLWTSISDPFFLFVLLSSTVAAR